MDKLSILDLIYLALSNPQNPELRLEKIFDWYFTREIEIVKWSLGAASGVVVALLPGMVDPAKFTGPRTRWAIVLAIAAIIACGALALLKLQSMKERAGEYVPALQIVLYLTGGKSP